MKSGDVLKYCLDYLAQNKVDDSQCTITSEKLYEISSDLNQIALLRSNFAESMAITALKNSKKGDITTNDLTPESLPQTLDKLISITDSSKEDKDYEISPDQGSQAFSKGAQEPDLDKMFTSLKKLINHINDKYPRISIRSSAITFKKVHKKLLNSNGTFLESDHGFYGFYIMFMAKDNHKISSFNYLSNYFEQLPEDIISYGNFQNILSQTTKLLDAQTVTENFVGDIIVTPQCLNPIVHMFANLALEDRAVYTSTSMLVDQLNKQVASKNLTLHSNPVSDDICDGYFFTADGYVAENAVIIDEGILKSYLLSNYGAKKANLQRSKNTGQFYAIEPGSSSLTDMIKNVSKGLFVARISAGMPAANGDFSGVAKNSFYIENGEIKRAVNETMINGNIYEMFRNITEISADRINLGDSIYPWIAIKGVNISGK